MLNTQTSNSTQTTYASLIPTCDTFTHIDQHGNILSYKESNHRFILEINHKPSLQYRNSSFYEKTKH